ncbi:CMP-N-acetlyneuraminic acid synthetase [Marinitoga sp. 1197]|uniref:acylneuraminate cytidylyltransferase family protein n=1 Tax=Marinitoga sp. 1197 TaxID=1428449 RepID=UPI000641457E|nr:acylneuraminate cytidylyltransferase family protein [Marinitoga sp. 1197]KLO21315.1 CMP-N-acetlyneuraminic acid synthetase [Marinitoga sp. 1197]
MYRDKKFLAIIPARGGSKGIKDKNIINLKNKPLISYTIEAAKKSDVFDEIMVTTDSKKIAEVAKKYGASVPFLRPVELSTDTANSIDVIIHTLNYYINKNINFDYFILLQPTSPLRKAEDILSAVKLLFEKNANSIVSICEVEHSPLFSNTLPEDLNLSKFIREEVKNKRRQDLPKYYRINGAIYISKVDYFLKVKDFYSEKSYAYIMPADRSIDIDNYLDLKLAELLLEEIYEDKRNK